MPLENYQYSPIVDYIYAPLFEDIQYNGNTLSDSERKEFVSVIDKSIAHYTEGLSLTHDTLETIKDLHDKYHEQYRTVVSIMLFVLITMIDSMVASKYFILADEDYDRRFMRGKLFVILNEGFKKLYGFEKVTYKKSEWKRLLPLMRNLPEVINRQYQELTFLLESHARSASWWKEERDLETHIDAVKLYESRQKEIIESKVMMDSVKLFNSLVAVDRFLTNVHACYRNLLVTKFRRGELTE